MQGTPDDFRLYHSNALDVLAGLLAAELRTPAPGQPLLAPDTILLPQVAMRRWLQATLAQAHGIADGAMSPIARRARSYKAGTEPDRSIRSRAAWRARSAWHSRDRRARGGAGSGP